MAKKSTHAGMTQREKMYLVLSLCCLAVLMTSALAFFIVSGFRFGSADDGEEASSAASDSTLVADSSYNKDEHSIDTQEYTSTILEESRDAGQAYVDETLFLGDSNTARMYRMFDFCTYDNAIGSVGMSGRSLSTFACVQLKGYSGYKTMAQAVALMQPRRVILTFGTNDLSPSYSASSFAADYAEGIQSIAEAYPSADIIVNSIPPLGSSHSNQSLSQSLVDEYNKALVEMCRENDWKFLNSAETLKDSSTGYAKSGYVEASDGIHLTKTAMEALFSYVRTHSYITEDDRPAVTNAAVHTGDKDAIETSNIVSTTQQSTATETPTPTAQYTYWSEVVEPTCTEQGYTYYHCNEDPERDYKSEYVEATGHDYQEGYCVICGSPDPAYAEPTPTPEGDNQTELTPEPEQPADESAGTEEAPDWQSESTDAAPAE